MRRDLLYRAQSEVVNLGPEQPWYEPEGLRARERASGRYCRAVPTDFRLTPIVEQVACSRASELWDRAIAGDAEGLVVVDTQAPIGRGKLKCKPVDTIDAVCLRVDRSGGVMRIRGTGQHFAIGHRKGVELREGAVFEVECEGAYAGGVPKFPRLLRERGDMVSV